MPRSRSISMVSSTCSRISRASRPPQAWISRSARVDLPWSIWAMIAKLRIWLSGGVIWLPWAGPEHKDVPAAYQRAAGLASFTSELRERDAERRGGSLEPIIVAGKFDRIALLDEKVHCRKVQPIQRPNMDRKRAQRAG